MTIELQPEFPHRTRKKARLVPGSLRAKATLKRFFYGSLLSQPAVLDASVATKEHLDPIPPGTVDARHSILYAVAARS